MKSMAIPPKKELRRKAKDLRNQLTEEQRNASSLRIAERLFSLPVWKEAKRVFVYASFGSEVSTSKIIDRCRLEKKIVLFPKMRGKEIFFYPVQNDEEMIIHPYGIFEPIGKGEDTPAGKGDLVLVPGLLFSEDGHRFGYGGGFYDRFLEKCPECTSIGLSFEQQISSEFPVEEWDQSLSVIVTEDRIMNFTYRS